MVKYIIKRVLLGILTLFVLIAITFAMTKVMPGSPLQSKNISGDVLKKMEATYGLDKPPVEQFIIYCKNLLHGDMGTSYKKVGKSVNEIIAQTGLKVKAGNDANVAAWYCNFCISISGWCQFGNPDGTSEE